MKLPSLGKIILLSIILPTLSGCVAMREKGSINLPQTQSSHPSVYLTASYTSYKNGTRRAFLNEYSRKDTLKKATQKAEHTGLFGSIYTTPHKSDLSIHCTLKCETTRKWSDFWMNFFTLQLYPDRTSLEYTLDTTVKNNHTGDRKTFRANDIITVYTSIWLLPAVPFMPATKEAADLEQYLFDNTTAQIIRSGIIQKNKPPSGTKSPLQPSTTSRRPGKWFL